MLLCLGLDYRRGGFVDRALEAFTEVLRLDPDNQYALSNLEKLLRGAAPVGRGLRDAPEAGGARRRPTTASRGTSEILAFLENELGLAALKRTDYAEAARRFEAAIELDAAERAGVPEPRRRAVPRRATPPAAIAAWERSIDDVARARVPGVRAARERVSRRSATPDAVPGAVPAR